MPGTWPVQNNYLLNLTLCLYESNWKHPLGDWLTSQHEGHCRSLHGRKSFKWGQPTIYAHARLLDPASRIKKPQPLSFSSKYTDFCNVHRLPEKHAIPLCGHLLLMKLIKIENYF